MSILEKNFEFEHEEVHVPAPSEGVLQPADYTWTEGSVEVEDGTREEY